MHPRHRIPHAPSTPPLLIHPIQESQYTRFTHLAHLAHPGYLLFLHASCGFCGTGTRDWYPEEVLEEVDAVGLDADAGEDVVASDQGAGGAAEGEKEGSEDVCAVAAGWWMKAMVLDNV